jgi:hypothetical protein
MKVILESFLTRKRLLHAYGSRVAQHQNFMTQQKARLPIKPGSSTAQMRQRNTNSKPYAQHRCGNATKTLCTAHMRQRNKNPKPYAQHRCGNATQTPAQHRLPDIDLAGSDAANQKPPFTTISYQYKGDPPA